MIRRLFTAASAISLLLFVAAAAIWAQGYLRATEFVGPAKESSDGYHLNLHGASWRGQIAIARYFEAHDYGGRCKLLRVSERYDINEGIDWDGLLEDAYAHRGFAAAIPPMPGTAGEFVIAAPCWFLALAFALMPSVRAVFSLRLRRRLQSGRCPICGYDLRASRNRCPECGTCIRLTGAPLP